VGGWYGSNREEHQRENVLLVKGSRRCGGPPGLRLECSWGRGKNVRTKELSKTQQEKNKIEQIGESGFPGEGSTKRSYGAKKERLKIGSYKKGIDSCFFLLGKPGVGSKIDEGGRATKKWGDDK